MLDVAAKLLNEIEGRMGLTIEQPRLGANFCTLSNAAVLLGMDYQHVPSPEVAETQSTHRRSHDSNGTVRGLQGRERMEHVGPREIGVVTGWAGAAAQFMRSIAPVSQPAWTKQGWIGLCSESLLERGHTSNMNT